MNVTNTKPIQNALTHSQKAISKRSAFLLKLLDNQYVFGKGTCGSNIIPNKNNVLSDVSPLLLLNIIQ